MLRRERRQRINTSGRPIMRASNMSTLIVPAPAEDYIAARCSLIAGLLSGLVLAQQAVGARAA
jgi:hypothetical protein